MGTGCMQKIDSLTSLRWFSAFYVFLFHVHIRAPLSSDPFWVKWLSQGAVGMSFFFILSGFILTHVYFEMKKEDVFVYVAKRFARIYPAYVLGVAIAAVVMPTNLSGAKLAIHYFANVFSLQGWFPSLFPYGINGGTWSLSVEWFFYLLFPYIIFVVRDLSCKKIIVSLGGFWFLASLSGLVYYVFIDEVGLNLYYSVPIYRLPEFLMGVLVGVLYKRDLFVDLRWGKLIAIVAPLLLCLYLGLVARPGYMIHNWFATPCLTAMIFYSFRISFLKNKVLVWLGEISYGFYILQFISLKLVETRHNSGDHPLFTVVYAFVLTFFLAVVSYYIVERPLRRYILGKVSNRSAALPGMPHRAT